VRGDSHDAFYATFRITYAEVNNRCLPKEDKHFLSHFLGRFFSHFRFSGCKFPARDLPLDQVPAAIKIQDDFDGGVTALFSDQNFPAKVISLLLVFAVFGTQVMGQVDPGADDLAAAGALHRDLKRTASVARL
jgi:hypothetical protein